RSNSLVDFASVLNLSALWLVGLDNDGRSIVKLGICREVLDGLQKCLDDLAGAFMAVRPYGVENALDAELSALRRERFHESIRQQQDEVARLQSNRFAGKMGGGRLYSQGHAGSGEDRLDVSFAIEHIAGVVPGTAVDRPSRARVEAHEEQGDEVIAGDILDQ